MPAWLQQDWCLSFVLTLGHFVWQGTVLAVVLAIALRATKAVSVRYWLSLAALLVMAACPIVTLGWLMQPVSSGSGLQNSKLADQQFSSRQKAAPPILNFEDLTPAHDVGQVSNLPVSPPVATREVTSSAVSPLVPADNQSWWQKFAPQLTTAYLCGVALMLLRLVAGLWGGRRLRRRVHLIDDLSLLAAMQRQATALGLKLLPILAYCERVTVPTVVGVLKPMILLPLTLTSGLSPEQIESVLAHELAHLRRYDHLVNLLQRVIESLLFFHPALWWVSHRIRDEREHCCDDLVVACGAMPLDYAKSLLVVAELSRRGRETRAELGRSVAAVSLLATGHQKPSNLRQRIARLLGESATPSLRVSPRALLLAIGIPVVAVIATIQSGASPPKIETSPATSLDAVAQIPDAAYTRPTAADQRATATIPVEAWGVPVDGLRVAIVLRSPPIDKDERLCYDIVAENVSDHDIRFSAEVGIDTWHFFFKAKLTDADGKQVEQQRGFQTRLGPRLVRFWLKPKERSVISSWATKLLKLDDEGKPLASPEEYRGPSSFSVKPGRYSLSAAVDLGPGWNSVDPTSGKRAVLSPAKGEWSGKLQTGEAPLTITSPPDGLGFLKPYPKLHGLSLDMTEPQFLEIVKQQELQTRKTVEGEKVTHHIGLGDGHSLIVMFDKDAKCSGIQRVRGEDDALTRPEAKLGKEKTRTVAKDQIEFPIQVVSNDGRPVVGAKVQLWAYRTSRGSPLVDNKWSPETTTDAAGQARVVILKELFKIMALVEEPRKNGTPKILGLNLRVEHPQFPTWSQSVEVVNPIRVVLAEPATIEVRAHRQNDAELLREVMPIFSRYGGSSSDWLAMKEQSQKEGVLTIRRVDLTSQQATRWLRLVHVPKEGPAWFSELIDLKPLKTPVSLNVAMQPGVRVAGRLPDTVPRPVVNGRVAAQVVSGGSDARNNWTWSLGTTITKDGSFVLESVPANENLQLIAVCDGWVSRSPTVDEMADYARTHSFETKYTGGSAESVHPRLFRTIAPGIEPLLPMEATTNCEVTVVDELGQPIADALVAFSPNQHWFHGGSIGLGMSHDSLKSLQTVFQTGSPLESDMTNERFNATTDRRGKATIANLPAANTDPASPAMHLLRVLHANYDAPVEPRFYGQRIQLVELHPGQSGRVTVRMTPAKRNFAKETGQANPKQQSGLEFLKPYPKLHGLSLDMTEPQFLEIVKQQELKTRKTVESQTGEGEKVTHHISLGDGHTLIVMFDKDAKCSGIQRVRGEDVRDEEGGVARPESSKGVGEKDGDKTSTPFAKTQGVPPDPARLRVHDARGSKALFNDVVKATVGFPKASPDVWLRSPNREGIVSLDGLPVGTHWLLAAGNSPQRLPFQITIPTEQPLLERRLRYPAWLGKKVELAVRPVVEVDEQAGEVIVIEILNQSNELLSFSEADLVLLCELPSDKVRGREWIRGLSPKWLTADREPFPPTKIEAGQTGRMRLNWREWVRQGLWSSRNHETIAEPGFPPNEPGKIWVKAGLGNGGSLPVSVTEPKAILPKEVVANVPDAAAETSLPKGLEFLKPYPKLQTLSLETTEPQFLEIVKQQELKTRKTVEGEKVTHHIALGDGHTLIVMFDKDAKCSGIQRVRGDDAAPDGLLGRMIERPSVELLRELLASAETKQPEPVELLDDGRRGEGKKGSRVVVANNGRDRFAIVAARVRPLTEPPAFLRDEDLRLECAFVFDWQGRLIATLGGQIREVRGSSVSIDAIDVLRLGPEEDWFVRVMNSRDNEPLIYQTAYYRIANPVIQSLRYFHYPNSNAWSYGPEERTSRFGTLYFDFPNTSDKFKPRETASTVDGVPVNREILWDGDRNLFVGAPALRAKNKPLYQVDTNWSKEFEPLSPKRDQLVVTGGMDKRHVCNWAAVVPDGFEAVITLTIPQRSGPPNVVERRIGPALDHFAVLTKPHESEATTRVRLWISGKEEAFDMPFELGDLPEPQPITRLLNLGNSAFLLSHPLKSSPEPLRFEIKLLAKELTGDLRSKPAADNSGGPPELRVLRKPALLLPDHWIVQAVGFDNGGKELVTASNQSFITIRRWDVVGMKLISEIKLQGDKHGRAVRAGKLKFSGDRRRVIAATDEYVGIWDATTGKLLKQLPFKTKEGIYDCAIDKLDCTPDFSVIVGHRALPGRMTLSYDAHVIVWDGVSGNVLQTVIDKGATDLKAIDLSRDGKRLVTTNGSGAKIWETSTGKLLRSYPNDNKGRKHSDPEVTGNYNDHVWSVQLSPDAKQLAVGDMLGVRLWDVPSGKLLQLLEGPYRYGLGTLVFSTDGQRLTRLGTQEKIEGDKHRYVVPIWSTRTGARLFELHTGSTDAAFSDDGQRLAVVFSDMQQALSVWTLSGDAANVEQTAGPGPHSRQDRVEENGHYVGKTAAEFIDKFQPTWGDAQLGLQYGIALTKPQQRKFRSGERVPLVVFFRNASDKPIKFDTAPDFFGNTPKVLNAKGEPIALENIPLLGHIPHYHEQLAPGEALGPFYLNFGLGENPRPGQQHWHPYWKSPAAGQFKLRHSVSINVGGPKEGEPSKREEITSGSIEFEIH